MAAATRISNRMRTAAKKSGFHGLRADLPGNHGWEVVNKKTKQLTCEADLVGYQNAVQVAKMVLGPLCVSSAKFERLRP